MEPILSVRDLTIRFGGVVALDAFSMDVPEGCIFGLIGPNGAGKTTCFNCISGLYRPTHGSVRFGQAELTRLPRHGVARLGLSRTFQNVALYPSLTVRENVMVGAHARLPVSMLGAALRSPRKKSRTRLTRPWPRCGCPTMPTGAWRNCRWASSTAWKSRGRW
jgi:branched-chain amino acid transport system ATP-binding protein